MNINSIIRSLVLIMTTLFLSHCKDNSETDKYHVGQEWNYKTRPGEESSTLKILKIEEYPKIGKVIHISISGLKIKNPNSPEGVVQNLSHIPILKKNVRQKYHQTTQ